MKRSTFTKEQIVAILQEQSGGTTTSEICRRHRTSSATSYAWKAKLAASKCSMRGDRRHSRTKLRIPSGLAPVS